MACVSRSHNLRQQHTLQVTFRSQEIEPHAIRDTITELGYGAEVKGLQPASRERRVARIQVTAVATHPVSFYGFLMRCA